jgi:hypothetical protein
MMVAQTIFSWNSVSERVLNPLYRLMECDRVGAVADHCNTRRLAAKAVQDRCLKLYLGVLLHRRPQVLEGGELLKGAIISVVFPPLKLER